MFGSSSTTSSRASACVAASVIDVFMPIILVRLAEETLNVCSKTAALVTSATAGCEAGPPSRRLRAGPRVGRTAVIVPAPASLAGGR